MRRLVCLLTVLMMCMCMVLPAYAAEDSFVPSITYKPNPELVSFTGEDGEAYVGVVRDASGEIQGYVGLGCLRITPIAHVWDEEIEVPRTIETLLQFVYEGLNDGSMEISYEEYEIDLESFNMVIRDLFDARFSCEDHPEMLEPEGVVLELTFDLGVVEDAQVYVQTYDEETGEWTPIVKTVNNGDGTVTCTFEHLCAIAFSMPVAVSSAPVEEPPASNIWLWILLLLLALVIIIIMIIKKNKEKSEEESQKKPERRSKV